MLDEREVDVLEPLLLLDEPLLEEDPLSVLTDVRPEFGRVVTELSPLPEVDVVLPTDDVRPETIRSEDVRPDETEEASPLDVVVLPEEYEPLVPELEPLPEAVLPTDASLVVAELLPEE